MLDMVHTHVYYRYGRYKKFQEFKKLGKRAL